MSNYESRLERLEQEIAAPVERHLIAYLYDGDTRPADWMELQGQRFDRGTDEDVNAFRQRVKKSAGVVDQHVIVVHYVASNGNGGPKFPSVDTCDQS
jgi:hypothetical protein